MDYAVRQKSSRMSFFLVEQLPMLATTELEQAPAWLGEQVQAWLNERAIELFYTNWELQGLAHSLGMDMPPFEWDPSRRQILQAEIDAAVLHLYGLDRNQADWVLDSFTVLRKYEERDHGEFRTRRLVLTAYDAMAEAKTLGTAYRTPLSPPPADIGLCHGADDSKPAPVWQPTRLRHLGSFPTRHGRARRRLRSTIRRRPSRQF